MKFAREAIRIKIPTVVKGTDPYTNAYLSDDGLFGVHRAFGSDLYFSLTHIRTGLKFPFAFDSATDAKKYGKAIQNVTDWKNIKVSNKDGKIAPESLRVKVAKACKEIHYKLFPDEY